MSAPTRRSCLRPPVLACAAFCAALACYHGESGGKAATTGDDSSSTGTPDSTGDVASSSSSSSSSTGEPVDPAKEAVDAARADFPTYLDLHTKVIARTCTPNMGVCHNIKEYPDLHTPQTMLGVIGQPCNLAEAVKLNIFGGCEGVGDAIELLGPSNPDYLSEVGYVEVELDDMSQKVALLVHLRDPIPNAMLDPMFLEGLRLSRTNKQGTFEVGKIVGRVTYDAGASVLRVGDYATMTTAEQALLEADVELGDPNQDGLFGASSDPYKLILPGDPKRSYLLQRLQGNVPGSPMPLANKPLSSAEIVALACWIEGITDPGLIDVDAAINYDDCKTAAEFGGADPNSGHSLSNNVQPILNQFCAVPGCHSDDQPQSGLVLTPMFARASLLEESLQIPGTRRVEPGNPTNSYLITKLTGVGKIVGYQMPITPEGEPGMLEDWQIEIIRAWIVAGAPND